MNTCLIIAKDTRNFGLIRNSLIHLRGDFALGKAVIADASLSWSPSVSKAVSPVKMPMVDWMSPWRSDGNGEAFLGVLVGVPHFQGLVQSDCIAIYIAIFAISDCNLAISYLLPAI